MAEGYVERLARVAAERRKRGAVPVALIILLAGCTAPAHDSADTYCAARVDRARAEGMAEGIAQTFSALEPDPDGDKLCEIACASHRMLSHGIVNHRGSLETACACYPDVGAKVMPTPCARARGRGRA